MISSYVKLGIASCLPIVATVVVAAIQQNKKRHLPYWISQIIIGVIFGGLAIVGTEWGIPLSGAMVNCRDAAPMVAGLIFGMPAGFIAGIIGGVERWIAVAWGVGSYTRLACSVSTIIAGLYAGLLRKFMFDDKHPNWALGLACGVAMEVFHLSMVFLTHMNDSVKAMQVVKVCSIPMIIANGLSLMLSIMVFSSINHENLQLHKTKKSVTEIIQRAMLFAVVVILVGMSYFTVSLHQKLAESQAKSQLQNAVEDTVVSIEEASDTNLLALTHKVADEIAEGKSLISIAVNMDITEISTVNRDGVITDSTNPAFIGFDFNSGEQSKEFMCLTGSVKEYAQPYGPITYDPSIYRKYAGVKTKTGFVQVGYDAAHFQRDIALQIQAASKNRHIGEDGFVAVIDKNNRVASVPDETTLNNVNQWIIEQDFSVIPQNGETFKTTINGVEMFGKRAKVEGFNIYAFYPVEEAMQARDVALYANGFMYVLMFALMFVMIFNLIKIVIVKELRKVGKSLGEITKGNLDVVVDSRNCAEFDDLSDEINTTVDTMKGFIEEASARLDADLATAKTIQESVLPVVFSKRKEYDAHACMFTAKEVGGDFYDFYHTHRDIVNFLIADVSGKGIPAAMFMMRGKTELKGLTETDIPVNEVFERGNNTLCEGNGNGMFITGWQGQIDLATGHVFFANAGHNPPVIMHAGGDFEYLKSRVNLVLAGMDGVPYKLQELELGKGDIIFLYTDGVTEATDANNELYGEDRLLACLNANKDLTVKEICERVKEDVDAFVKEAPQFDDITMLAFKYFGKPESPKISFEEASLNDIPPITEFVEEKLSEMGCPMKSIIAINIAIDELYSNIVNHGYGERKGPASVIINEYDDPHGVEICFVDQAIPYNPIKAEDPDTTLSAEERGIGGLGIFMVKKSMDDMSYEYKNGRNILKIRKNF